MKEKRKESKYLIGSRVGWKVGSAQKEIAGGGVKRTMDKCFSVFWRRKELKKSALGNRKKERKDEGKEKGKQVFDWEQSGLEGRQCVEGDSRRWGKENNGQVFQCILEKKRAEKECLR